MSFTDDEFPATRSSLYINPPNKQDDPVISWRRPSEFSSEEPALYVDGSSEGDVQQGALGDCWFLGALSVVAMRDDLLHHLFVESDVASGRYVCKFFKEGAWQFVTIDDLLPCDRNGMPIYGHCALDHELWVPLMEKAYAKLHGSYQALEGGSISEGLVDITGGAPEEIDLDEEEGQEMYRSGLLWRKLLAYQEEQYLLGAAYICDGEAEADLGNGLLQNHAYGIMKITECHGIKLMQCRNPWGQKEWNGDWSDESALWTDSMKADLGVEALDDGVFWMCFDDFVKNMNRIYIARLYEDDVGEKWQHTKLDDAWQGESAGGCVNFPTWHLNPQYAITPSEDTEIYLCVNQPDKRMSNKTDRQYVVKLGFNLLCVEDSSYAVTTHPTSDQVVLTTTYLNVREIARDARIEAGKTYVFVPSTFNPGVETRFVIEVYARKPVNIRKLSVRPVAKLTNAWSGDSAGGCVNHPTWCKNPQILVNVQDSDDASLTIALEQEASSALAYIGFLVIRASHRLGAPPAKSDVVLESAITNVARVAETAQNLPAGDYVIVPSTFEPNQERSFTIEVAPTSRVGGLSLAAARTAAEARGTWFGVTAGGCPNHATWRNNPQFLLSGDGDVELSLVADAAVHVGWYAFRANGEARRVIMNPDDIVARSPFTTGAASATLSVSAGEPLLILPCTFEADVETDFTLAAYADGMTIRPLKGAHMISLSHGWSGSQAGGCTNHPTWMNNPKYRLCASEDCHVQLLLTLVGEETTGLGILVTRKEDDLTRGDIVGESDLMMGTETGLGFDLKADKPVWVLPVTFEANVQRDFQLTCYSENQVSFG